MFVTFLDCHENMMCISMNMMLFAEGQRSDLIHKINIRDLL